MFLYKQFKSGAKLICILSVIFTISILLYKLYAQNWYTFALLAGSGLALAILILYSLKNKEQEPMYLPLVPAFSVATLYFLFF